MIDKKPKVLIVDDEHTILSMYKSKFAFDNFDVVTAKNGEEALKVIAEENPDLILLDILMPVMDGYEFLKELRKKGITIPVIVLSNLDQESEEGKSISLGACDYMVKAHVTPKEVLARAKSCL